MKSLQPLLGSRVTWTVVALVLAALCYWLYIAGGGSARASYDTAPVSRGNVEQAVASSGTISPLNTVPVGSQVSGQLIEIDVDFNSKVKKGQLLAVVDPSTFRSKVRAAEADMVVQQATIGSNEVQVSNAQVVLEQAQRDYERTKTLADQGLLSTNDLEKARNSLEQAQNALKIAGAVLNNSRAQLVKVRSQLDQARIDLSHTEIRAPVDGVVIDRSVDLGQTVQSAMTVATLFKIARDLSRIQIETKVDEADIGAVQQASGATFKVDAYPERSFNGRIAQVRISGSTSSNVVTYSVMVQADNPDQILLPGMTANVKLITAERRGVLRLPNSALRFRPGADARSASTARPSGGSPGAGTAAVGSATTRALVELTPEVMQRLGLDAQQQVAAAAALKDVAARIRTAEQAANSNPLGGGMPNFRRMFGDPGAAAANRQRILNALAAVMSAEQLQKYQAMSARVTERDATVYVLDASGNPEPRKVRVGLADDNYTELLGGLAEGDKVIVRAVAKQG
jgi:HlyD family secretion protein